MNKSFEELWNTDPQFRVFIEESYRADIQRQTNRHLLIIVGVATVVVYVYVHSWMHAVARLVAGLLTVGCKWLVQRRNYYKRIGPLMAPRLSDTTLKTKG